ncbi:MAG TPA: DUF3536 domain-containing protein, partial [Candidatus Eisenbacteria bacterium]|nr:DUF3536 domain-containing protein [Candidatus Eisenbacteria bacterium]
MTERRLCVHGHFYQPPRENPWIESVELQESAAPFHDWNDRIHHECYQPNAVARVLDAQGSILRIVNNFESISFNFGPTLMAWLESVHPETYERVLEADRQSVRSHEGHGNAIAQAYNHMILPLANRRDKVTQVRWGLADFRHRFGREAEALWLPETACNEETVEVLIEHGLRYVILEPHQAEAVRPLSGEDWRDVSNGGIDPRRPYRCFSSKNPDRFIDVFFYDGPLSKAVSFEDLLFDAKRLVDRFEAAAGEPADAPQLVSVSTDGETYGHHKAYGDRVLAYALNVEAPARGFRIVNFGEFLDACPPREAVRLKAGENGEGTSWSCAHGVRRWKDACGCRGDGPAEWNQAWRRPLREAFDWLRDELAVIYEKKAREFLKDPWAARDAYIEVILGRAEEDMLAFLSRHAVRELSRAEVIACVKLLEMQRHAMLMYTSCGWFFTELSGIETIQVIQYAARAVELAAGINGGTLEEELRKRLAEAKSNLPEFGDGRAIYDRFVKPRVIPLAKAAAFYAICSIFEGYYGGKRPVRIFGFHAEVLSERKETFGNVTLNFGRLRIGSGITLESEELAFVAAQTAVYDFHSWVRPLEAERMDGVEKELFGLLQSMDIVNLFKRIGGVFGEKNYGLKDLLFEDRLRIISILTKGMIEKMGRAYENLYDENLKMNEVYHSINLPIPREIRYAAEHTLSRRLRAAARELAESDFDRESLKSMRRIIDVAREYKLGLDREEVGGLLTQELSVRAQSLEERVTPELV